MSEFGSITFDRGPKIVEAKVNPNGTVDLVLLVVGNLRVTMRGMAVRTGKVVRAESYSESELILCGLPNNASVEATKPKGGE